MNKQNKQQTTPAAKPVRPRKMRARTIIQRAERLIEDFDQAAYLDRRGDALSMAIASSIRSAYAAY